MSTYSKVYAVPTAVTLTRSITSEFILPIRKVCTSDLLDDPCCSVNFHLCGNDEKYYQPVCIASEPDDPDCNLQNCKDTDILNFQFSFPDNYNAWGDAAGTFGWTDGTIPNDGSRGDWLVAVSVIEVDDDCTIQNNCTANFEDYTVAAYVGALKKNGKTIQGIQIDPSQINCCQFYFKFELNFAIGDVRIYYTEPFKKVDCCAQTVRIDGEYPKTGLASTDCDEKYYGLVPYYLGTLFYYQNFIRIPANFKEIKITPTIVTREGWNGSNMSVVSTTNTTTYRLRSGNKIPLYVVKKLGTILAGKAQLIDDKRFIFSGDVSNKISDLGEMWLIENEFNEISGCLNQFSACDE